MYSTIASWMGAGTEDEPPEHACETAETNAGKLHLSYGANGVFNLAYVVGQPPEVLGDRAGKLHLSYGAEGSLNLGYADSAAEAAIRKDVILAMRSPKASAEMPSLKTAPVLPRTSDGNKVEDNLEDLLEKPPPGPASKAESSQPVAPKVEKPSKPLVVHEKRESALMKHDPVEPDPPKTDLQSKAAPAVGRPASLQSDSPSKEEERNQTTAPATPEASSSATSASRGNSGVEAEQGRLAGLLRRGPNQTTAYQALSTNEYNPTGLQANRGVSDSAETLTTASGTGNKLFPSPTPFSSCGGQRAQLRDKFNLKEIDVDRIWQKYDVDRSGQLEQREFRKLLAAFIGMKSSGVRNDEYKFVMAVADKDHDECISKKEVLYGLQAWYAFYFMPQEVNSALKHYEISQEGSRMPSRDVLRTLLVGLNSFLPVEQEEVNVVRNAALAVGATEDKVTSKQMRMAISVWYIHIMRRETEQRILMEHSASILGTSMLTQGARLLGQVPTLFTDWDDIEAGHAQSPTPTAWAEGPGEPLMQDDEDHPDMQICCRDLVFAPLACWLLIFILPGLYMVHVAGWYPSLPACEHDLSFLIEFKGYLLMTIGFSGLLFQIVHAGHFKKILVITGSLAFVILILEAMVGFFLVLHSDAAKCGSYLYTVNQFFFVWSIFWFPCCCLTTSLCAFGSNFIVHYWEMFAAEKAVHVAHVHSSEGHPPTRQGLRQPPATKE